MAEIPHPIHIQKLIGHDDGWSELSDAWKSKRFAHAWLITGPRGIGKASFAYLAAKAILTAKAEEGDSLFGTPEPQGLSRSLDHDNPVIRRMISGAHPDLLKVEIGWTDEKQVKKRTEIVIDDVRAVGGFLSMTPAEGGWRVVVVDAVDEMNRNAANALLKNLEEPPKNTVLLLVAHNPGRLLPTIRSRCRRLPLKPLSDDEVSKGLSSHLPDISEDRRQKLVSMCHGSLGEAITVANMDGDSLAAEVEDLLSYWPKLDILKVSDFATRMAADPERFRLFTIVLGDWLSKTMKLSAGAIETGGAGARMNSFVQAVPLEQWFEVWEKINDLFRKTDAVNLDRRHVILSVFHSLVSPAAI